MLNFKGWNKIAEDKETTTLKHDKGHEMRLAHKGLPKIQREALKRLKLAEGTTEGTVGDQAQKTPPPVTVNVGTPAMSQPMQSPQPVPVKVPEIPQTPSPVLPNGSMNAPGAMKTGVEGAKLGANIQAAQSQAAVPQIQQYMDQTGQLNQDFTNNINSLKQHADDLAEHVKNNPLNENAYLENRSSGRKMMNALGMILSGAGAGVTGGPNLAYDYLNKQIDRNIDAQKERFGQQKTIWGAYHDLYQNEQAANNMARVHALDMLTAQAKMTAAQLGTATAAQGLMDWESKVVPERNKLILDSAGSLGSQSLPGNNGSVPGTNQNQQPVTGPHGEDVSSFISHGQGMPESEANIGKKRDAYYESHVLEPNANAILHGSVQQGGKFSREDYPKVQDQLSQAAQAEKAMSKIDEIFPQLDKTTNTMGSLASSVNPHALAAVGGALGAGAGALASVGAIPLTAGLSTLGAPSIIGGAATAGAGAGEGLGHVLQGAGVLGGNKEKQHQALKSELMGIIMGSYPNATQSEVNNLLESKTPGLMDNKETYQLKLKAIKDFIKSKLKTDLLEQYGMVKKR